MKIKDVERLTGLTAKSIRHYEAKGLIEVERKEENSYRSYTEDDIKILKRIKLLRYLEFSIAQIREMQGMDEERVQEVLQEKAEEFSDRSQDCQIKRELCQSLSEDSALREEVVDEYTEAIEFLESDEMDEFTEGLKDISCPSLSEVIVQSLICLGPILSLFLNIARKVWSAMLLNSVLALLCTALLTGTWIAYTRKRRYQKKRMKKKNRQDWWIIPIMIAGIVATMAAYVGIAVFIERKMSPEGWLFYELDPRFTLPSVLLVMFPILFLLVGILLFVRKKRGNEVTEEGVAIEYVWGWNFARKHKIPVMLIWLAGMYICFTNVTFVTEDRIVRHTSFCPQGKSYSYDEVTRVKAQFGDSSFALQEYKRKGQFSYIITVDHKKNIFSAPSDNESIKRYEEHTYLELEEFDQRLMELGIEKESDDRYADHCDLDKEYVERFLRIIHNR